MGAFRMAKTVLRSMFSKPATLMYPVVEREYPERTRGRVDIDMEACILCGLCGRRCPAKAIETKRNTGEWIIHRMRCIQCGECIDVCPKDCLMRNPQYTEPSTEKVVDIFDIAAVRKSGATTAGTGVTESLVCDMELCVFCGLCAKNCPVDALKVDRKEKIWEVDEEACVKCGACIDKCPKKCLDFDKAEKAEAETAGSETPETADHDASGEKPAVHDDRLMCDLDECIYCGICAKNCPVEALVVDRKEKIWEVDEEACIKCEACINKCPKECLFLGEPPQEEEDEVIAADAENTDDPAGSDAEEKDVAETTEAAEKSEGSTEPEEADEPEEAEEAQEAEETEETAVPEGSEESEDTDESEKPEETYEPEEAEDAGESAEAEEDAEAKETEPEESVEPDESGEPEEAEVSETPAVKAKSVPVLDVEKCIYCRMCENMCPEEAILAEMDDWTLDVGKCISCRVCIGVCPAEALQMSADMDE